LCSLFEGTKINVVPLGGGFRPLKVLITDAWGFIVTFAVSNVQGNAHYRLFVHNVNGRLIRDLEIQFAIDVWCCFASRNDFNHLVVADETGKLFVVEAFYCAFGKPFHRCVGKIVGVSYLAESSVVVAVRQDGLVFLLPLIVES
jgi:hypothetical protein